MTKQKQTKSFMYTPRLTHQEIIPDTLPTGANLTMVAQWYAGLARKAALEFILGSMPGKLPGKGLDFRDLREYQSGDDLRHLDWRASARSGKWLTRQFQQEHGFNLSLVVDTSASMGFGSNQTSKQFTSALLASFLAWIGRHLGCKMSLFTLGPSLKPRIIQSRSALFPILASGDILYAKCEGAANWTSAWDYFQSQKHSRGLVFFLSDFWDPLDQEKLSLLARKIHPVFLRIQDKAELAIPSGLEFLAGDPESSLELEFDGSPFVPRKHREAIEKHNHTFQQTMAQANIPNATLSSGKMVLNQFMDFLSQESLLRRGIS